ncbi:MAG: transporter substrate-binding domain-containing protein [Candidatus Bipolaricaulota bacterium]|nr:MAG: transporter substrate-binding domain-containing protein [Candidatus Bipolaricaulota bacterium]
MNWKARLAAALLIVLATGGMATAQPYIVASDIPWAPFEMITADGEFFGFDLDLFRAIAHTAGFEIEIQNVGFDVIIENVKSGLADIGVSGFTITEDREKVIDFSMPYYLSNQAVVIQKGSGLNIVTALAGLGPTGAVGAQNATTGLWWAEDHLQGSGIEIEVKGYETYPSAILDLVNGRVDAVIQDEPASVASVTAYPDDLQIAGIINTYEYFGFLVAEGDPEGLLPQINGALETLGLTVVDGVGGLQELVVAEGSFIADLLEIYFGPDTEDITAAWIQCKDLILAGDLAGFVACMKAELGL